MPAIHHHRLAEAVEAGFCWDLPVGFRFFLARLLFLDIETPFFFPIFPSCHLVTLSLGHLVTFHVAQAADIASPIPGQNGDAALSAPRHAREAIMVYTHNRRPTGQ